MGITGQTTATMMGGGTYTAGGPKGAFHIRVADASIGLASTGRPQFILDLEVHNDPDHPGKEGKKLKKMYQSGVVEEDGQEKGDTMRGMLKRLCYDGFGIPWTTDGKPIDPRKWIGKEAWVMLDTDKNNPDFTRVVAVAQTKEGLPLPKGQGAKTSPPTGTAPGTTPRGRRS